VRVRLGGAVGGGRARVAVPRASIRLEDAGLVAIVLAAPLVEPLQAILPFVGDPDSPAGGAVSLVAVLGAMAAMLTRLPAGTGEEARAPVADRERLWIIGPFVGAVGFVGVDSLDRLGLPGGDALVVVAFLVVLVSVLLADRLPVVPRPGRRILVAPFVLLSGAFFQAVVSDVVEGLGGASGPIARLASSDQPVMLVQVLAILGFAAGIFYMMLVFVPRELADPGASAWSWAARFGLFYASLLAAILIRADLPILFP
jgi:hypothetical protein